MRSEHDISMLDARRPSCDTLSRGASTAPLLDIRGLCVEYLSPKGPVCAAEDVWLSIAAGQIVGLAGESGCGKSTVAHAIMRLLRPPAVITGGQVLVDGDDVLDMDEQELARLRWRKVALVFQSAMNALNPVMKIGDQIADAIIHHLGASREAARARAAELLDMVGIDPKRLDAYPHELSGGMRQRAVIAIALALNPALLLMDEPTTALDVVVQREILQQIESLKQQLGFAILFITHDLSLLVEFADQIAIMYAGRIVEQAPARELFERAQHPYTEGLMGSFPPLSGPKQRLSGIPGAPP
ncbi:MAG TPA: ABC transporter ATP-binding protein, partial [Roseiflexaceae bacterium]|nr:ABC transporter ATP-binding protein [Roseiflexaceae bacterium]